MSLFIVNVRLPFLLHPELAHTLLALFFPLLSLFRFVLGQLLPIFLPPNFLLSVTTCHLVLVQCTHLLQQGESALLLGFQNNRPPLHIRRSRGGLGELGFGCIRESSLQLLRDFENIEPSRRPLDRLRRSKVRA